MQVRVLYFAAVRERLGLTEELLELTEGATVAAAFEALCVRHGTLRELRRHLRIALNQEMAEPEASIHDGDELALIPPVAGGRGPLCRLQEGPLSIEEALAAVAGPDAGGTSLFIGTVRKQTAGRTTRRLEYEAYPPMVERTFRAIAEALCRKHGARLAILHRTGTLELGEAAVVIAAAAPHRAEAFAACQEAIDRLKREAPIWKKEISDDGGVWVGLGP